jgi:phenylalanyl-tRNA synthetase beta chain
MDFFDIKGVVELLLGQMKIEGMFSPASDVPFLHPGKSAWVMVGGREAGYMGQVHPDVMKEYNLPLDAFVFELKLEDLIEVEAEGIKFRQLPRFPAIERDIAAIVPEDVTSFNIIKAIESMKLDLMEDIRLFDYFSGGPIPEGRKSLAYTITYRSPERTLTDDEVNAQHQLVMNMLKERLGADIRER